MRYIISLLLTSAALPALAEVPKIVTDLPPVHSLTAQVMGDLGQPVLLLDRGANAHSFQLRPSQARALSEADLVIWIGPEMTPWLDRALDGVDFAGDQLELLHADGTILMDFDGKAHAEDDDDHAHAHAEDDDDHADHAHEGLDPHAWLDPDNAILWVGLIADRLAALDPENAPIYERNASDAAQAITGLDAELTDRLTPVKGKPFVVFHGAYGYFTSHFGLMPAEAVALGDATTPGAARIAALRDRIETGGVPCLFPEAQHDPAAIAVLAQDSGARIGPALDPSGSTIEPGKDAYAALLTGLADNLLSCLSP